MQGMLQRRKTPAPGTSRVAPASGGPLPINASSRFQHDFTQLQQWGGTDDIQGEMDPREKYSHRLVVDPNRMRIDAVADFIPSSLKARKVNVTLMDAAARRIEWQLRDPGGKLISSVETSAGDPDATSRPFDLSSSLFKADFMAGQYVLSCTAYDERDLSYLHADRDFYVLSSNQSNAGFAHGPMYFSKWSIVGGGINRSLIDKHFDYEVDVELGFFPDKAVTCQDICMMQTAQILTPDGAVTDSSKPVAERTTQAQWRIDFRARDLTPWYLTRTNFAGVPEDAPDGGQQGWGGEKRREATSIDKPAGTEPSTWRYETCAICRSGADAGQVFGCATWGFTTDKDDNVDLTPRSLRAWPTDQFIETTKKWNLWAAKAPDRVAAPELKP